MWREHSTSAMYIMRGLPPCSSYVVLPHVLSVSPESHSMDRALDPPLSTYVAMRSDPLVVPLADPPQAARNSLQPQPKSAPPNAAGDHQSPKRKKTPPSSGRRSARVAAGSASRARRRQRRGHGGTRSGGRRRREGRRAMRARRGSRGVARGRRRLRPM